MAQDYSWRKLWLRLIVVVVAFAAANVWVYYTSEYFRKERQYHRQVEDLLDRRAVHVLLGGDSHVEQPLNDFLNGNGKSEAYSVAFGGDSLRECFAKFRYALDHSSTIDTIVLEVDPHMFGTGRLESSNRSFADRYFLIAGDQSGLRRGWLSTLMNQVPLLNDEFVQYLRKAAVVTLKRSGVTEAATRDSEAAWSELSDAEQRALARETGRMDHVGVGEHAEPLFWTERILRMASERRVRVLAVRFPVRPEYAAEVSPAQLGAIDGFLARHGVQEVVDLRYAITDPRDFDDPDHVDKRMAQVLVGLLQARSGVRIVSR